MKPTAIWLAMVCSLALPFPAGAQTSAISFAKMVIRLAPGSPYLTVRSGVFCRESVTYTWDASKSELDNQDFEPAFRRAMQLAGIPVAGEQDALFESSQEASEYRVGGVIKSMHLDFCYGSGLRGIVQNEHSKGTAQIDIDWQLYSVLERRVVARISTSEQFNFSKPQIGGAEMTLDKAFEANVSALAVNAEFRGIVLQPRVPAEVLQPTSHAPIALQGGLAAKPRSVAEAAKSVALVLAGEGHGSGFLVSSEGHIITNEHVVGGAKFVKVRWPDGKEVLGEVVRTDRRRDVALIKADSAGRQPLGIDLSPPDLGQAVLVIGAPLGKEFQGSLSRGVVSAANREYESLSYIQSDVTVNPGNSGGPLLSEDGRVIGITNIGLTISGMSTGINLFIPIADALKYLNLQLH